MKKAIPNIITSLNLFAGCAALVSIFQGFYFHAAIFIACSLVLDFFDGFSARILKVKSLFGKELDSLADMVSFGVVPGAIFYKLLTENLNLSSTYSFTEYAPALLGFVVTIFAALRLAKFNLDQRQEDEFRGLSTPPATVFTLGLLLIHYYESPYFFSWVSNPIFLFSAIALISILLVSDFPMFAMKNKSLKWKGNEFLITLIILSILLLFIFREAAFSINVLLYIFLSFLRNAFQKSTQ